MNKILLTTTLFVFAICNISFSQCHPDIDALLAVYNATDGPNWIYNDGWVAGAAGNDCDVCEWDYVTCNSDGRVKFLSLSSNLPSGTIPPEIGDLEFLESLSMDYCGLTGTIPAEIGQLTNLTSLRFFTNELTGSIPASIGNLVNLETLNLAKNDDLGGELPASLGNLVNLEKLFIHNTNVSGSIPASFGNMTNMDWIEMSNNQLTGELPASLGNLTNIGELDFSNNNLTGQIPHTLSQLSNAFYIGLDNNDLSGCIPIELAVFCNTTTTVDIAFNPQLPGEGDWDAFCNTQAGACDPVAIHEAKLEAVRIFPNPTRNFITIDLSDQSMSQVLISTAQGKVLLNQSIEVQNGVAKIDIQHLPTGIYFLKGFD